MRGVPDQKNASGLEFVGKDTLHRPAADEVDLRCKVGNAERCPHPLQHLGVIQRTLIVHGKLQMEDPLLGPGSPIYSGPWRPERRSQKSLRNPG
jgi:hypothetical protein